MNKLTRYRGDTSPDQFTVRKDGVVVDITGCTFKMTVNSEKDPTDTTAQLFTVDGTIVSAVNGQVDFSPDATQADQTPGDYFYDVQMTTGAGVIQTIDKGRYRFVQDITKA